MLKKEVPQLHPLKSFKQFPGGMAYYGAFSANAEKSLRPYVTILQERQQELAVRFAGHINSNPPRCDFSFTLYPLPKIPLYFKSKLEFVHSFSTAIRQVKPLLYSKS